MTGAVASHVVARITSGRRIVRRATLAAALVLVGFLLANRALASDALAASVPGITVTQLGTPAAHCSSTASLQDSATEPCASINLFGAGRTLLPGGSHRTTMLVGSSGSSPIGTLSLVVGRCAQLDRSRHIDRGGLCEAFRLSIETISADGARSAPVSDLPLGRVARTPIQLPAPGRDGQPETVRLTLTLDPRVRTDDLGDSVSQPMRWQAAP